MEAILGGRGEEQRAGERVMSSGRFIAGQGGFSNGRGKGKRWV